MRFFQKKIPEEHTQEVRLKNVERDNYRAQLTADLKNAHLLLSSRVALASSRTNSLQVWCVRVCVWEGEVVRVCVYVCYNKYVFSLLVWLLLLDALIRYRYVCVRVRVCVFGCVCECACVYVCDNMCLCM